MMSLGTEIKKDETTQRWVNIQPQSRLQSASLYAGSSYLRVLRSLVQERLQQRISRLNSSN